MARLKATKIEPTTDYMTGNMILAFEVVKGDTQQARAIADRFLTSNKPISLEVKEWRERRSLDANAYMWALCNEIAIATNITKEEVYRRNILEVGVFEPLPIKEKALESFIRRWASKGTGWVVEIVDDSKLEGYKRVNAYYGSSTYNTKEMTRLIDCVIQDAVSVGIQVMSEQERSLLLGEWDKAYAEKCEG